MHACAWLRTALQAFKTKGNLQVAYAGVAQLCADGAREWTAADAAGTHGVVRIV